MKIIGINGSPKAKGNTRLALDTMGEVFAQEGIDFEVLHIGHKLSPCSGCFRCAKTHTCTLPDDGLNAMYEKLIQADGGGLRLPGLLRLCDQRHALLYGPHRLHRHEQRAAASV